MVNDNDRELNIETEAFIEWPLFSNLNYNRTESTDYPVLDKLVSDYLNEYLKDGRIVDYGSGKGRVLFYLYAQLNQPEMVGIEYNNRAFSALQANLMQFADNYPQAQHDIILKKTKAEVYLVQPNDTTFYFFNPFTVRIFKKVVTQIIKSIDMIPRQVDIILYYPEKSYIDFLDNQTYFETAKVIKMPRFNNDTSEYIVVYQNSKS